MADQSQERWRDHARGTTRSPLDRAVGAGVVAALKQLPKAIRVAKQTGSEAVEIDVTPIVYAVLDAVALGLPAAIECVLADHVDVLAGERVDANLAELAFVYRQLTGFDATKEAGRG